ncbi:enoyl-[acyl-carrier protein] reductase II [Neobacillus niacini]|uniref:NAD(P)H-dependent flavin oxidoreductase n=1 Tax=Neobacillus niacini TaxID=86668 RepID=UPI002787E7A9|nr:nitronate monooxygenase [Neobacillus niacini]MDQ1005303.1 enoyl-[acyl-carrier protein] reductase II [Neobacillus niacini]
MRTKNIGTLLGIKHPILLAGMAGISDAVLAAAVSNAGGLGTIAGAMETSKSLSEQIKRIRELTDKPFAVNIPLLFDHTEELVETVIKERVKVIITAAGDCQLYTERLKAAGCIVIHVVPSPKQAKKAEDVGVDAVIAEGFESGGAASPYEIGTIALIPQVVDSVNIPVIAAGGIGDARGYLSSFILGASGVSLGTVFLTSKEAQKASSLYKEMLLNSGAADTAIAAKGVLGIRLLKNNLYYEIDRLINNGADRNEIKFLISSRNSELLSCGQGVGLIENIRSVYDIIEDLISGAKEIIGELDYNRL